MSEMGWLAVYSVAILAVSLCGGGLPFLGRISHRRMQFYLATSAGVMLGASFFHIMPHAMEFTGGNTFGWWMSFGVLGVFCIERFIAPHSHEGSGHSHGSSHNHTPGEICHDTLSAESCSPGAGPASLEKADFSKSAGDSGPAPVSRPAAPALAGWMMVLGLTLHTFMNGVGLAAAVQGDFGGGDAGHSHASCATAHASDGHDGHDHAADSGGIRGLLGKLGLPGLALFLAIALHKPADALAVTMVLARKGVSRPVIMLTQFGFAAMVPAGAFLLLGVQHFADADLDLENQIVGMALAFSAGAFLVVALCDLLPEVQFHTHDRFALLACLAGGLALMAFIDKLEGHDHGAPGHGHSHASCGHSHAKKSPPAADKPTVKSATAAKGTDDDDCCDCDHDDHTPPAKATQGSGLAAPAVKPSARVLPTGSARPPAKPQLQPVPNFPETGAGQVPSPSGY